LGHIYDIRLLGIIDRLALGEFSIHQSRPGQSGGELEVRIMANRKAIGIWNQCAHSEISRKHA